MLFEVRPAGLSRRLSLIFSLCQLNDFRKAKGETFVLLLNSLMNDCGCSKPSLYAISLADKSVADNFSFAFSIALLTVYELLCALAG